MKLSSAALSYKPAWKIKEDLFYEDQYLRVSSTVADTIDTNLFETAVLKSLQLNWERLNETNNVKEIVTTKINNK